MLTKRPGNFENSITVETGLSDHHKMTLSVLKKYFKMREPIIIEYRDHKHFNPLIFRDEIRVGLGKCENYDVNVFNDFFKAVTNKHAPIKRRPSKVKMLHL